MCARPAASTRGRQKISFIWLPMAVAAAALLIGVGLGYAINSQKSGRESTEIAQLRGEVNGMRELVAQGSEAELEEMEKKWREENERIMRIHPPEMNPQEPGQPDEMPPVANPEPTNEEELPPEQRPLP